MCDVMTFTRYSTFSRVLVMLAHYLTDNIDIKKYCNYLVPFLFICIYFFLNKLLVKCKQV